MELPNFCLRYFQIRLKKQIQTGKTSKMKKGLKITLISVAAVFAVLFTFLKVKRVSPLAWGHHHVNQPMFSNQAIDGYDVVAYFTQKAPLKGNESYSYEWKGANWSFASEENKKLFVENPEKYVPQYGGYCAFAVSKGFTASTDPTTFEIIEGKLYLFDSKDVKTEWMANLAENKKVCDANWE